MPIFHPRPHVQAVPIDAQHDCLVVDGALLDPDAWVAAAAAQRAQFVAAPTNAYPGIEAPLGPNFSGELDDFFRVHVRGRLGARRTLSMRCRMSMVTLAPGALMPRQWICHRDSQWIAPGQCLGASVLYLFRDERLGGTSFYRPRRDEAATERLSEDAGDLDGAAFTQRHGVPAGYMLDSNDWFERLLTVPPRYNRMIFYDGGLYHTGQIPHPGLLTDDPATGRLTINGFFTCTRKA